MVIIHHRWNSAAWWGFGHQFSSGFIDCSSRGSSSVESEGVGAGGDNDGWKNEEEIVGQHGCICWLLR